MSLFLLLAIATSCISKVEKSGYILDLADYQLLQEGVTSKERLLMIMGSPTIISELELEETWLYYTEDVKKLLFFKPDIIDRTIVLVRFNKNNIVKELKTITIAQEEAKLHFATNHTPVLEHKTGFFKSIFNNVGQVKAQ